MHVLSLNLHAHFLKSVYGFKIVKCRECVLKDPNIRLVDESCIEATFCIPPIVYSILYRRMSHVIVDIYACVRMKPIYSSEYYVGEKKVYVLNLDGICPKEEPIKNTFVSLMSVSISYKEYIEFGKEKKTNYEVTSVNKFSYVGNLFEHVDAKILLRNIYDIVAFIYSRVVEGKKVPADSDEAIAYELFKELLDILPVLIDKV